MMPEWAVALLVAIVTGGLFGFIQFLISRKDKKNDDLEQIKKQQIKQERDSVRLQLMLLMELHPESIEEIMKCAQHYFDELKGNWYMTSIFNNWILEKEIAKPEWFNEND